MVGWLGGQEKPEGSSPHNPRGTPLMRLQNVKDVNRPHQQPLPHLGETYVSSLDAIPRCDKEVVGEEVRELVPGNLSGSTSS